MDSNFFTSLRKLFEKLPGIGPRQANRFLWALLDFTGEEQKALSQSIAELSRHMRRCETCFRAFNVKSDEKICSFCVASATKRDHKKIMIVEKDNDILNIERSGA